MQEDELLEMIFGPNAKAEVKRNPKHASNSYVTSGLREITEDVLSTLTPREKEIVKMRFGLDSSGQERSAKEVGSHFNVTAGRVRQIEAKALAKLRHPSRSKRLRAFFDGTAMAEAELPELDLSSLPGWVTQAVLDFGERTQEGQVVLALAPA